MRKQIFLQMVLFLCVLTAWGQSRNIKGKVVSAADNEPLIGVSVIVKGTVQGTSTDANGDYSISVDPNATLVISYIGYIKQEVEVGNQFEINVSLTEDTKVLDEVVVIGYGTARKSDVTGAVARANLTVLENSPNVNILQTLKGVVPGLNIGVATTAGGNPDISIRGRNSISGTTSPLIVLDGIIYRGEFTDINPNDIGSIDVLKDASSAAIYGSQGANGVILITTKGTTKMSKPIIEYSGQFTGQRLINGDMKPIGRDGFIRQLEDCFISESRMGPDLLQRNPNFDVTTKFKDTPATDGYLAGTNTDWWDLLSNSHPYVQNHNLSIRGKGEMASYFISFGFTDQKNIVKNDTYKRYSLRVNVDTKITDWLKFGTQSYYNLSDFSGNNTGFGNLGSIPALVTPYAADGSLKEIIYLGGYNPLLTIDNPNVDNRNTLSGTFYGEISIPWVKGLSYRANFSRNWETYKTYTFDPYANNSTGAARKYNTNSYATTFDNIVTYKNDFGKHSVNATLVYGVEKREYENTEARSQNFTDKTLIYNKLGAGQADLNKVNSDAWKETSLYTMARVVYSYNDRYVFTGTVRRDGFSGFTEDNKFAVFPSAALAWRLSEENFVRNNVTWIDNLKLRFSYGMGGNRTAGRYSSLAKMKTDGGYLYGDGATGQLAQYVETLANNNLKWETTTSTNIGLDFSVLGGRLSGYYEFYVSKTKDLLYNVNVPKINGTENVAIPTNIGKLQNIGHELSISGIPVRRQGFEWEVTANFSTNKNKVITILGIDADGDGKEDDLISSNIFIGKSLDPIYDYNITGMWQVADYNAGIIPAGFTYGVYKVEDINKDDKYSAGDDRKILGYKTPLYRFSILNTFRYKGFELKAMINSIQGGKNHYMDQPAKTLPIRDHLQNNAFLYFDYWTPENPNAKYRQLGEYNTVVGSAFSPYVSRSFIRLQELSLAYNFSSNLLSKVHIARAKIYVTATNLFTITKWDGWDPEANQGIAWDLKYSSTDMERYPTMKSYSVGLNFEF